VDLSGNSIVGNASAGPGGGVYLSSLIEQFVVRGNVVAFNVGEYGIFAEDPADMDYNCVFGHDLGDYGGLALPGPHDLTVDPLLEPDQYHLQTGSPCINRGDPGFAPEPGQTDVDGHPRVIYERVDIGADEWLKRGDFEGDADVDLFDFGYFQQCFNGPAAPAPWSPPSQTCQAIFDFDSDTDVDITDYGAFLDAVTGP